MLDLDAISRALGTESSRFIVDLLPVCDSTNSTMLGRAEAGAPPGTVVVARNQTAGRGRRGRAWISTPGDSLTFSLLWHFAPGTVPVGLSLAVGVAVTHALVKIGAVRTALKWPNDVLLDGRKLAGILVELVPGAPHSAVIGLGLNLRLPQALPGTVRETAAALDLFVDINVLLATLLIEFLGTLERFAISGFPGVQAEWASRDAYADARVTLSTGFAPLRTGICRGVDRDGALLLEVAGRIERVLSGEVSLRAKP